jgi:dolichol-phosphate mannosyltransferase
MDHQAHSSPGAKETEESQRHPATGELKPGDVVVALATYNERSNIERLIPELLALPLAPRIVIVDDGSPDGTAAAIEAEMDRNPGRIELIRRPGKMGYGSAFVAGFARALEIGAKRVVSMDADYSHDPQSIPMLAARLDEEDLTIGSRYIGGIRILNWSFRRLLLSTLANQYVKTILGFEIQDCTSGFRAYRAEALRSLDFGRLHSQGYSFLVEILEALHLKGMRIGEAPIVYHERREGQSKMSGNVIVEAVFRPFLLRRDRLWPRP